MSRRCAGFVLLALACPAWAQVHTAPRVAPAPGGPAVVTVVDPADPALRPLADANRRRVELERELNRIRTRYFANIRNTEIRQAGLSKLREFTDPAAFPSLLKVFRREKEDVRGAILDHLADLGTEQADATLAWAAVFDHDAGFRAAATDRLIRRARGAGGEPSFYVKSVIARGLASGVDGEVSSAARLAEALRLYEAIPMLINAQISGRAARVGGGGGDASLASILIGKQQAFVADLTPVVGDSAVAFDPTLDVVTEGVYLRVIDAVVLTYRVEVHNALVGLSSAAWGRPTDGLGWDNAAWHEWYAKELKPHLDRVEARRREPDAPTPAPGGR